MSRTPLPDGAVRYAPDLGHRSKRKQPYRAAATALTTAVPLGVGSFFGLGADRALPIVGWTVVVTLVLVLIWRVSLPRQLSVTASATELTFRSYGRKATVRLNQNTTAAARLVVDGRGFQSRYLVFAGDGGSFKLNLEMWSEDDLVAIAGDRVRWTTDPATVTVQEFDCEYPGLLPVYTTHPNRFAIGFLVVAVLAVLGVMAVFAALTADRGEVSATRTYTDASATAPLSAAASAAQNRLQAEVQRTLAAAAEWEGEPVGAEDCRTQGGWQRTLQAGTAAPRTYTDKDLSPVAAAAEQADLALVEKRMDGSQLRWARFQNEETEATLVVEAEPGFVSVETTSGCAVNE